MITVKPLFLALTSVILSQAFMPGTCVIHANDNMKPKLKEVALQLKYGYVFEEVNSGQMWIPEEISFRFKYKNKEEYVRIISHFVNLQRIRGAKKKSKEHDDIDAVSEFKEFVCPGNQKIKGLENDPSFARVSCYSHGFFSIMIKGMGDTAGRIVEENFKTALYIDKMVEKHKLQEYIAHEICNSSNCLKRE